MELDPEGISRQVRWQGEGLHALPWGHIVDVLETWVSAERLYHFLHEMIGILDSMPNIVIQANVPKDVIVYCQDRWAPMAQRLRDFLYETEKAK